MALDDGVSKLIERIYLGAEDTVVWNGVLDEIVARTNSRFIMVSAVDLRRNGAIATDFHGPQDGQFLDGVRDYNLEFYKTDPTLAYGIRYPDAGFVSSKIAAADQGMEIEDCPYAAWTRGSLGVGQSVVRYTPSREGLIFGVSLHPAATRHTHDKDDLSLFQMLFRHMDGARRLAARPPDFLSAQEAWLLLDDRLTVKFMSDGAASLLKKGDGLSIVDRQLTTSARNDNSRLWQLLRSAIDVFRTGSIGGSMMLRRPSGRRSLILRTLPLTRPEGPFAPFRPSVAVSITDPDQTIPASQGETWKSLFGFTPAETRLAHLLVEGEGTLRQHADQLGIAHGTARVHLRNIFDKAQVRSQTQLMRLLTRITGFVMASSFRGRTPSNCSDGTAIASFLDASPVSAAPTPIAVWRCQGLPISPPSTMGRI